MASASLEIVDGKLETANNSLCHQLRHNLFQKFPLGQSFFFGFAIFLI
jgi:hypothetical protein